MTDIYNLFNDLINQPSDYTDCYWYKDSCGVYWNADNEIDQLFHGDDDTYFMEVYGRSTERDGYVFYTLFDGCGNKVQAIFDKRREIDVEAYWEEYNRVDDE